jgi:hypothetical protein
VDTTHSIYDRPYRTAAGTTTIRWVAEACVACVKNSSPDLILGGASYGFQIPYNSATSSFGNVSGIGPDCVPIPSTHFRDTLHNDPTTSGYRFRIDLGLGPGDFPLPDSETRYA